MSEQLIRNSILLISDKSIFNPKGVKNYEHLTKEYSAYLDSLLLSNWIEIFSELENAFNLLTILDASDKEYIPKYLFPESFNIAYYDCDDFTNSVSKIVFNSIAQSSNFMILYCNSIGISKNDIIKAFNLLQSDESSVTIGNSKQNQIVFVCTSKVDSKLVDPLISKKRQFDEYMKTLTERDVFIQTLDKFLSINEFQDIKKLYIELSKKESLAYCSPKMHERFNDLFIEYKDLLNV